MNPPAPILVDTPEAPGAPRATQTARRLLRMLDESQALVAECRMPVNRVLFLRDLRGRLETAIRAVESLPEDPASGAECAEARIELDWLVNQCKYWFGTMDGGAPRTACRRGEQVHAVLPAMTFGEHAAIASLLATSSFLAGTRRNLWTWLLLPIHLGRGAWAAAACGWEWLRSLGSFVADEGKERVRATGMFGPRSGGRD
jgi:hypothetical protein